MSNVIICIWLCTRDRKRENPSQLTQYIQYTRIHVDDCSVPNKHFHTRRQTDRQIRTRNEKKTHSQPKMLASFGNEVYLYIIKFDFIAPRCGHFWVVCGAQARPVWVNFGLFMFYCLNFIRQWLENLQQFNILI